MAGAKAVVITDNDIYDDSAYIQMIGDESEMTAKIPAGFLVGKSGLVTFYNLKIVIVKINITQFQLELFFF